MQIQGSTACFPGKRYAEAVALLKTAVEPLFGKIHMEHVQLCPQSYGVLTIDSVLDLAAEHPDTRFRLHANVRVGPTSRPGFGDAVNLPTNTAHFIEIARISRALGAVTYTMHPGKRGVMTLDKMKTEVMAYSEAFMMNVGVEGMYPDKEDTWLINSWDEYEWLLDSGLSYAVDLSHVNILARRSKEWRGPLVRELLASPRCIEIHVSDNDGSRDQHTVLREPPSWWPLLVHANSAAIVFTEGNQLRET